ncbi:HNH endonuclease [Geomonas sp. RF6]|uniref:HNH endonuclease n=1 Tax=Geomonas sp. RF6 TaxID=2897342 RepID=UPI001E2D0787|nr:HNH endonuclease [Geomonas sp. RF6]UFS69484.1 HNH endonuclease [Geomonas sp. RF6]
MKEVASSLQKDSLVIPREIKRDHLLYAIKEIDSDGVPPERESTVWLLRHEGKDYPPKYVISIAGKYALGYEYSHEKFSGGPRTNSFLRDRGFEIISKQGVKSFSWKIVDDNNVTKILDKSSFLHRGTGIPQEIRSFFLEGQLGPGERVDITLAVGGEVYSANITMESQGTARTRLFWDAAFTSLLHTSYPHHLRQYQTDQQPSKQIVMQLGRINGYRSYAVMFGAKVSEQDITKDVEAEQVEDVGPRLEGGVKEYYGRRYERDAINRQKAIEHHGLACNICGFNFEKMYGERGSGYIEVHHIKPISTFGKEQHVDPRTDLITVCCNCHRMIHRRSDEMLSVDDVKGIILKRYP